MAEVGGAPAELMPPPAPRTAPSWRVPAVLDEDEWTEQLEAIIERDYFPDKAKLENKLEWLQVLPALMEWLLFVLLAPYLSAVFFLTGGCLIAGL